MRIYSPLHRFIRPIPNNKSKGKRSATSNPVLSPLDAKPDIKPTSVGPMEQPTSPNKASKANMAVPPPGHLTAAKLKVPGQRIPTEKPQSPHPKSATNGIGTSAAIRYPPIQRKPHNNIACGRLIRSLHFA